MGFESCGPNEVLVVTGVGHSRPKFATGRIFVWPKLQKVQRLCLNLMTLSASSKNVKTKDGHAINVTGTFQVKIHGYNKELLCAAAELFLDKTEEDLSPIILRTATNHQSAGIGTMEALEIYSDRKKFSQMVFEEASSDLINMGLVIVSYTVKEVNDDHGYFRSIAKQRADEKSSGDQTDAAYTCA